MMKANPKESNERMRHVLRDVSALAVKTLSHQPKTDGACWRHLSKAIGTIRGATRLGWAQLTERMTKAGGE